MSSSSPLYPKPGLRISARTAKLALLGLFSLTALIWLGSRTLLAANFLPHWYCYLGIYLSGHAEGLPEAQLPLNSAFLQKPFRFATLLEQLKLVRRRA